MVGSLRLHRVHDFQRIFGWRHMLFQMVSVGARWPPAVPPNVLMCVGGGPHNFPMALESPAAAHVMFLVLDVDSGAWLRELQAPAVLAFSGEHDRCQA